MGDGLQGGFHIGDVGAGAQVAQGVNITQTMQTAGVTVEQLRTVFADVFAAIKADDSMDDDEKQVAAESAEEVLQATAHAGEDPSALKRALSKAKKLLGGAWNVLATAMKSDPVQKTLGTITEAALQASIKATLG
jgi:hypothetical protein